MKRMLAWLLCCLLMLSVTGASALENELAWIQYKDQPITLEVYSDRQWFGTWDDPVARRVTEKTGANLNVKIPVQDENEESISLMIASNSFPDIMVLNAGNPMIPEMAKSGLLANMDELMATSAPALTEILNTYFGPETLTDFRSDDGVNYSIPFGLKTEIIRDELSTMDLLLPIWLPRFNIRQDWYDEAGAPEITSAEDYIDLLTTIKQNHPDALGVLVNDLSWYKTHFGIEWYYENEGKLFNQIRDPKYVEMMKSLNSMANAGLLPKDGFVNPYDVIQAKYQSGDAMGIMANYASNGMPLAETGTTELSLPPWDTYTYLMTASPWMVVCIPKASPNAERAIAFLEYCASPEGHIDMYYGIEGEEMESLENGPHFSHNADIPSPFYAEGKPVLLPEAVTLMSDPTADFSNMTGLRKHFYLANDAIMDWGVREWSKADPVRQAYNQQMTPYVIYRNDYRFVMPDDSDRSVIEQKVNSYISDQEVKMAFAKDEAEVQQLYDEMIVECDRLGMPTVEDAWTAAWIDYTGK